MLTGLQARRWCKSPKLLHMISLQEESLAYCMTLPLPLHWLEYNPTNSQHEGRTDTLVAPLEKAPDPYLNSKGGLISLLQLKRKAEFHASTRDKAWLPCTNAIGNPRSMSELERLPEFHIITQKEPQGFHGNSRKTTRFPLEHKMRPPFPAARGE